MARSRRNDKPRLEGETFIAIIEELDYAGRGVARIEGKTVFIEGALPGETVSFSYVMRKKSYDEGLMREVIIASPQRVAPFCPKFGVCGGCCLQHLESSQQIKHKQQILLTQLQHLGRVTPREILEPIVGPSYGYRRRARLGVRYVQNKAKVLVGFHEKASNKIADIDFCPILTPQLTYKIADFAQLIGALSVYQQTPQIEVAVAHDQTAVIIRHLKPLTDHDLYLIRQFAQQQRMTIFSQSGGLNTIANISDDQGTTLHYRIEQYNLIYEFKPWQFVQVNPDVNKKMVLSALTLLDLQPQDKVADFFCGLGNFTLPMARMVKEVVGFEVEQSLVEQGEHNARLNQLSQVRFQKADLFDSIQLQECLQVNRFTKILLDPPRTGALELVKSLPKEGLEKIVYISCNPGTLARDAEVLVHHHGFNFAACGAIDMFPQTAHVEAIGLFTR